MTPELLKSRLQLLGQQIKKFELEIEQQNANLNMLKGGREELVYWLHTLAEGENKNAT